MRFRGGGVGHKSTREATDQFLQDRDHLDVLTMAKEQANNEDLELTLPDMEEDDSELEEDDYAHTGWSDSGSDSGWEDDNGEELDEVGELDFLGAEDGADVPDPFDDLGFAEL